VAKAKSEEQKSAIKMISRSRPRCLEVHPLQALNLSIGNSI